MSFFKSLVLAIIATLFITYVFGIGLLEMFDIDIYLDQKMVEPLQAISFSALVVVFMVLAAAAIMFTVFGTLIFIGLLVGGAIVLGVVGVFWPILLIALVIWLICRDKPQARYG